MEYYFTQGMWSEKLGMTEVLYNEIWSINLPKVCILKNQAWLRFYLILNEICGINLRKICSPRNQAWPTFYLILNEICTIGKQPR